jgi:3-phenylpropionate/trans-cinnamate dioxygenase ferredoxin reductase subunit/benzoate/toluate 1,2-dioxygenase reductase subunit
MTDARHPITLLFEDGVSKVVQVSRGQRIAEAAEEASVCLLVNCREGMCGTCTAQVLSGSVALDVSSAPALTQRDLQAGVVLTCVARAEAPAVLQLPYASYEALSEQESPMAASVGAVSRVADSVWRLELVVAEAVDFLPGQYVHLRPDGCDFSRSYSMANPPGDARLTFFVRAVDGGKFSRWVTGEASPGATVWLSRPRGTFFLREDIRPRVFVAGGTGLAPFLSMLRTLQAAPLSDLASAQTSLVVGARTESELFALDELRAMADQLPSLKIMLTADKANGSDVIQGRVTDALSSLELGASTAVYLCGPPAMVAAASEYSQRCGVRRSSVLSERFA